MVKRCPLEATLMNKFDLDFCEARELISQGRDNLGVTVDSGVRSDELKAECIRLARAKRAASIVDVHFDPSMPQHNASMTSAQEIFFDPSQPMHTPAASPASRPRTAPRAVTTTKLKKDFDYDFYKEDYDNLEISDDDDDDDDVPATNVLMTPQPAKKATLSKLMRRRGKANKGGTIDSDDLSFLVEPLGIDESIQDTKGWEKDVATYFNATELDIRLDPAPPRPALVAPAAPTLTPSKTPLSPTPLPLPVPAALDTKSPASWHKTSDATHVTEASTVDAGIPSVIYIFHRPDDDFDDDLCSMDQPPSPVKRSNSSSHNASTTPKQQQQSSSPKKSILSRFNMGMTPSTTATSSSSPSKKGVARSKSSMTKRERENFQRLYVDL